MSEPARYVCLFGTCSVYKDLDVLQIMEISLFNRGGVCGKAIVSAEDFARVAKHRWNRVQHRTLSGVLEYAYTTIDGKYMSMHRFVWNAEVPEGMQIDHKDRIGLHNSGSNLRLATRGQNGQNRSKQQRGTSQYVGVQKRDNGRWTASCADQNLGGFASEVEAAKAYDIYALVTYGPDAYVNTELSLDEITEICERGTFEAGAMNKKRETVPRGVKHVGNTFQANLCFLGKHYYLGCHRTAALAKEAYDRQLASLKAEQKAKLELLSILYDENHRAVVPLRNKHGIVAYAIVDADDWHAVMELKWSRNAAGYPVTRLNKKTVQLHRFIYGPIQPGNVVDHRNRDKLDARNLNLREATRGENSHNITKSQGKSSQYRGVSLHKSKKWCVQIKHGLKHEWLGLFPSEVEAARCYNARAMVLYGVAASLNTIFSDS